MNQPPPMLKKYFLACLSLIFLIFSSNARAQTYSWRTVEVGGGGFVTGIVFHPTTPNLVYARTDVGGAYRLDNATSRWIALNDDIGGRNNEFQYQGVLSIGVDASDSNKLYLACGQYGGAETWKLIGRFYRSSDRGATWNYVTLGGTAISGTTAYGGVKFAGNGEGRGAGEIIAVDPANSSKIVIGSSGEGLWRSTNGGSNWTRLTSFDTFGTTSYGINFVMYAPTVSGTNLLYAAAKVTTQGPSLWRSTNGGTTWTAVPNQPGRVAGSEMFAIQGSFDAAGTFYMTWADQTGPGNYATHYEVWKLAVDGVTWTKIMPPTGQGFFAGVSADPRVAGHVLVTTLQRWWPGDEVYRSTDGGATWTGVLRSGTRSPGNSPWSSGVGAHWMTDIALDPFNSDRAMFNNGFGIIATNNLSTSGTARTWTFFCDGLEELVPLDLLSPTAGAPLISVTGDYTGFRHDDLARSPIRGRHSPSNGSNDLLAGSDLAPLKMVRQNGDDTYYSQNGGASWAAFPTVPNPTINGAGRVALSASGQRILWCPPNSPAYFSADNGSTWMVSGSASSTNSTGQLTFSTLAGALGTPGMVNSNGGNARFTSPTGVAVGSTGIRYVADTGNHLIRKIAGNEAVSTLAGSSGVAGSADTSGTNAVKFSSPAGIIVSGGNIYVGDTGNHTIRKVTSAGEVSTLAGLAGFAGAVDATGTNARFNSPNGIGADGAGNLYVADTGNHGIRKITPVGEVTTFAGTLGVSGTADLTGTAASFNSPKSVAVDAAGNVYVADTGNHVIRKITSAGEVATLAGGMGLTGTASGTGTAARFNSPAGITIDAAGSLYVADTGNNAIRKITSAGVVTTLAGGSAGAANGTGSAATFQNPAGIAVDAEGLNIYVADTGNHGIRKGTSYYTLTPLADRVDDLRLYLWDGTAKKMLTSTNGGASFSVAASGVNSAFAAYSTVPGKNGHIWVQAGGSGLYQSTNFATTFTKISSVTEAYTFGFGKAATSGTYPAVFLWGKVSGVVGFFRSDNAGSTWTRINDNLHQFGNIRVMAGDPRVYGRVYLATSGRGVVYGDLPATTPPSQPTQVIYDDALRNSWSNASPGGTTLGSTLPVRRGTAAISVTAGTGRAVSFSSAAKSTAGYAALSFWIISGTSTPPPLQVGGSRGGIALEAVPVTVTAGGGWQRILVPLNQIGLSNIDDLTGVRIESTGTSPGAFSVDDVVLVGADDFNNPSNVTLTLGNLSATYDGTPKSVTVTTNPAGRPVAVTYNGSTTPPTAAGSYAVAAFVDDPLSNGSASGTLVIGKANASVLLGNLAPTADGTPKPVTTATTPPNLAVGVTYNGSGTPPTYAGSYAVVATINETNYQGSTSATLVIRQAALAPTGLTGWSSNIAGKVTVNGGTPSNPLLNPDDPTDTYSTNTLQALFSPITLANAGDKIVLTGTLQMTGTPVASQSNWFRFGLYDNRGQASNIATDWLGWTGMGNSLYERTSTGLFSTGNGATERTPDGSPAPVSSTSPAGNPPLGFEVTITRTGTGVVVTHLIQNLATSGTLMRYSYTDTTPNNNGLITGAQGTPANPVYTPTYNTAGFAFGRTYIGATGAQAQFSNIRISFTPGVNASSQYITFPQPADRAVNSAPFGLAATASSGLPVTFAIVSGPATLSSGTMVAVTGTGSVVVRASQSGNLNYLSAPDVDQSFNVIKATGTVTLSNLNATYDGTQKSVIATPNPSGLTVDVTYNGSATAPTDAGSYPVVATINSATYQGSASDTFVIAQRPQTISFTAPPAHAFGDAPFALSGTASSGLPLSFSVVSGPATVSGSTVTLTGAGTVVVRASQSGNTNYLAAPDVDRSFAVSKATATVTLGNLSQMFDGQPKSATVATAPDGLDSVVTYNGLTTLPITTGSYSVIATVNDTDYQGTGSGTLVINRRSITTDLTGWVSNIVNKVSVDSAPTSSPLLTPDDTTDASSTNTLQAAFAPITMANTGDKIVLTGSLQLTGTAVSGQGNWFRFGLYDRLAQPLTSGTGWLGLTGMGNSLHERTSAPGLFSTGNGATPRSPDSSPTPISSTSPSGNPSLAFEVTITRTGTSVVVTHLIQNLATSGTLMRYSYTDTTPNNNGLLTGAQASPTNPVYSPTFNTAGFGFARSYIGTGGTAKAQFYNVQMTYTPAVDGTAQTITFAPIADHTFNDPPIGLSGTATSGLPVSFSVLSGPATVSGTTLTVTGAGSVVVRASQAGSYTYLPALPVDRSFDVAKDTATVTLGNLTSTYDGTPNPVSVTTTPNVSATVVTYNGSVTVPSAVGSYTVVATVVDDNYEGSATGAMLINPATFNWNNAATGPALLLSGSANWAGGAPPFGSNSTILNFFTGQTLSAGTVTVTQDLGSPFPVNGLGLEGSGPVAGQAQVLFGGQAFSLTGNEAGYPVISLDANAGAGLVYNVSAPLLLQAPLTVQGGGTARFVFTGGWSGPAGFAKTGSATLTLDGSNSYAGATLISEGTLLLNGTITNSASVMVDPDATLAGNGSIASPTQIDGTLSPGDGLGTLTVTGSLAFGGTSHLKWELGVNSDVSGFDKVIADTVDITAGATLDLVFNRAGSTVNFTDPFWTTSRSWPVLTVSAMTGNLSLGNVSIDSGGRSASSYGSFSLQQTAAGVTLVWTPVSHFQQWQAANFGADRNNPAIAGPNADPDLDSVSNLMEFALALNPNAASVVTASIALHGANLGYTYTRSKAALGEVTFTVEYSDDLSPGSWSTAGIPDQSPAPSYEDANIETIEVLVPAGSGPKRFIRLRVTR